MAIFKLFILLDSYLKLVSFKTFVWIGDGFYILWLWHCIWLSQNVEEVVTYTICIKMSLRHCIGFVMGAPAENLSSRNIFLAKIFWAKSLFWVNNILGHFVTLCKIWSQTTSKKKRNEDPLNWYFLGLTFLHRMIL